MWPSGISVVPRRPGSRPSLTQLCRRLLWRGRSAVVTATQKAVPRDPPCRFAEARVGARPRPFVSPRPEWVPGHGR